MLSAHSSASRGLPANVCVHTVFDLWTGTAALQSCMIKRAAKQC